MQPPPFDTCWLLRLRALTAGAPGSTRITEDADADAGVIAQLQAARRDYALLGVQPDGSADDAAALQRTDARLAVTIFRRVWKALGELPPTHPLYIPPIYEDDEMLANLLLQLTLAVRGRERSTRRHDTGHFIVGGVEGTGKTTRLKAIAAGVAVCSSKYFLVYVDYKELPGPMPPVQIIGELYARVCTSDWTPPFGGLRSLGSAASPATRLVADLDAAILDRIPVDPTKPDVVFSLEALLGMLADSTGPFGCSIGLIADEIQERSSPPTRWRIRGSRS